MFLNRLEQTILALFFPRLWNDFLLPQLKIARILQVFVFERCDWCVSFEGDRGLWVACVWPEKGACIQAQGFTQFEAVTQVYEAFKKHHEQSISGPEA